MLALLLVNISSPISVYLSYQLNKEYIATELCENKDRPELACNGQCVLMKKLQQINRQAQDEKTDKLMVFSLSFKYLHSLSTKLNYFLELIDQDNVSLLTSTYTFLYSHSIKHPPQV